ncbi:hypothetical protein BJ878DRAFT_253471 [Calycina marina]|uniref:WIBG Mago-binding domain-containing protein n=1 Tax=Calycina marina TaxID=1763456 RepID=A0A9P7YWM1_9HELO|nr:hypothetical protein BJ878DRAFT_253471 [Calycina marina]
MPSMPTPTKAGIIETNSGERHIPSSVRPDGTKRKEIKIRPGYKPPEDVEVYKNRTADGWKQRKEAGGIPGAEGLKGSKDDSAVSNKNAKRREARKKAKFSEELVGGEKTAGSWREKEPKKVEEVDLEAEKEKKARNLKKKLKQAKELKDKKEGGGVLLPEQFAKVIKINELIRELDALGFNADGEPNAKEQKAES